jgi:hypothetical protein
VHASWNGFQERRGVAVRDPQCMQVRHDAGGVAKCERMVHLEAIGGDWNTWHVEISDELEELLVGRQSTFIRFGRKDRFGQDRQA